MQVTPMPSPSAHIHDAISACPAPMVCAAWNTITAELAKPTRTVMNPATTAGNERSLKKERAEESVIGRAGRDPSTLWLTASARGAPRTGRIPSVLHLAPADIIWRLEVMSAAVGRVSDGPQQLP